MVYPITKRLITPWIKLFVRKVHGIENIPKPPFIIAANHDSYLDPLLIISVVMPKVNKKIHYLAMRGRFWNKFGDTISGKWAGCVPLDPDRKKVMAELLSHLKNGDPVGLFPGGARSHDGELTKGKTGAARLALAARVPVIPIGIIGAYDIAPRDELIPRLKRCELNIGKPIYFEEHYNDPESQVTREILDSMTDRIMVDIGKLINKKYLYTIRK